MGVEVVFLDIGGVLYRDQGYRDALRRALRELGGAFADEAFDAEYDAGRQAQSGSFRDRLSKAFLGRHADVAEVEPARAAMVGDRLDYDVRPARAAGMRTIWALRGEAPDEPTREQLAEADAAIRGLDELPDALEIL
jgi:FMN phosphatase YigB (HAD superfamily)